MEIPLIHFSLYPSTLLGPVCFSCVFEQIYMLCINTVIWLTHVTNIPIFILFYTNLLRIFNVLSSLMAEEGNCMLYHKEIHNNLKNKVPFVPYLGFFLTQVVHQRCHQNMCKQGMRRKGAILNHYKILTPTIRPCKEYNSSFCCPNGDNLHFYNPVGWSTPQSQVIPDISYSYDDASDACNINDGDSFGHEVCQFDKRCASLLHLNLIRGAFTTNSLSGSLHAPSEHSTSSSTHSCVGLSYRSIESLDLCGPKHETQYPRSVSHKMSASLCSLGPEHEMNIQLAGSHSDTPLHQGEDCDTSNIDEYNHLLGLSYLMSDSSSVSLSPSPAHSRCSLPGTGTSADDEPSSSWYGDYRFHSAKSSGATNSVKEDNSPSTSICHLRDCSIANDIDNDKVPSSIIQYHMVTSEDTPYEERGSPPCVSPPAIASGDMWDSNSPDYARLGVCLERRRHAIHADFRDTKDPKVLLMMYQMSSLDCSIEIKERVSIGNIMTDYCFNTEAENYELSYQREPKCTRREISKEPSDLSNTPLDRTRTEKVQETKQN